MSLVGCAVFAGLNIYGDDLFMSTDSNTVSNLTVKVDVGSTVAFCRRSDLMGVNIASYNDPDDFRKAIRGPFADVDIGLIRIPGGSFSDKYYWNGNGVISNGCVDSSKFKNGYWDVDYSAYCPGFSVDSLDWSKALAGMNMDVRTMHEITRMHPKARNMVTVNAGTGTAEMAAEWVRWANIKNDYDVKYWEIGNELNGEWEAGHIRPDGSKMTPDKYVKIYIEFAKAMKAVDPTIKIGGPACDVRHHEDYFEPLLSLAGEHVDFLTMHFYSLRNSLAPERELFDGISALKPHTDHLKSLVEKYQPERKDEIELSITEWNSKLPKDQDAYRLFNGLWFSAWIGEMMQAGVNSATVWDMFSGADNGHGLLVEREDDYVPTGRYWAFWLWSNHMADTLVQSDISENPDVHVYATRDTNSVRVLLMNESRTTAYPVRLDIDGMDVASLGEAITLSSREYFWNPYAGEADWNFGPKSEPLDTRNGMSLFLPPYCVKVIRLNREAVSVDHSDALLDMRMSVNPELRVLLPASGAGDLPVEGWVRSFEKGSESPYPHTLDTVHLSVEGSASIVPSEVSLYNSATRFVLTPEGAGDVTVTAECKGLTAQHSLHFKPVKLEPMVVWDFESQSPLEKVKSDYNYTVLHDDISERKALRVDLPGVVVKHPKNLIFAINSIPKGIPKARIGGVTFDLLVPSELEIDDPHANIQAVMQSTGAYWIPCGQISLNESRGEWRTLKCEIPDKAFLSVMDKAFSVRFIMTTKTPVKGSIYIDNVGFILRSSQ